MKDYKSRNTVEETFKMIQRFFFVPV